MIVYDLVLFILPLALIIHRRVLDFMTERKRILLGSALGIPVLHFVMAGFRWQVMLLYIMHLVLAMLTGFLMMKSRVYKMNYKGVRKICAIFMTLVLFLSITFPVGHLFSVEGPYTIGTAHMILETEREEVYGDDTKNRVLGLQFYYPADKMGMRRAPLIENGDVIEKVFSEKMGVPRIFISHLSDLPSNAWYDVEISADKAQYPVVILSHGWKGFKNMHENLAEELASSGFVVVSIDHAYSSLATVLEDGRVLELNESILPNRDNAQDFIKDGKRLISTCQKDIDEVLGHLFEMNEAGSNSVLSGKLNLEKTALIGYATGGGAAVLEALESDVTAVIGLDAWLEPLSSRRMLSGLDVPYLHLESGQWTGGMNERNLNTLISSSRADQWSIVIEGSKHTDFTMLSEIFPFSGLTGLTGIHPKENQEIQIQLIKRFLAYYVEDKNTKTAIAEVIDSYDAAKAEAVFIK